MNFLAKRPKSQGTLRVIIPLVCLTSARMMDLFGAQLRTTKRTKDTKNGQLG